jgi:serine/threonine-protein kinase RsbW
MGDAAPAVKLTIPAHPRFLRVARLTAAGIAGDIGFSLDEIEDLRVAVDEACAVLIDGCDDPAGEIELRYRAEGHSLVVEGSTAWGADQPVELHPVAQELLSMTADACEFATDGRGRTFLLRKERDGEDS